MKIETRSDTLRVSDLRELDEAHAGAIHDDICAALPERLRSVEIDLSGVRQLDSTGASVLMALYDTVSRRRRMSVIWRLVNPAPPVRQLLELMRLHRVFEITPGVTANAGATS